MRTNDFLTELSNEKLAQYKTAAAVDASKADKEGDFKKGNKRFSGIVKATKKQFANDEKNVEEGVGLPSPGTYEQTNDMFKSSGQRRIGALTNEQDVAEEKQRIDPKCWTGYKKQGTKMKGGTRVNNCVPVKESAILKGIKG